MTLLFKGYFKDKNGTIELEIPIPQEAEIEKRVHLVKQNIFAEIAHVGMFRDMGNGKEELIPAHMFKRFTVEEKSISLFTPGEIIQ